jgi:predicted Rossmann-fold nucleotide-binding protein
MKRICVFCGSSAGSRPEYRAAAEEMGAAMVLRNTPAVWAVARRLETQAFTDELPD